MDRNDIRNLFVVTNLPVSRCGATVPRVRR
jgi:hypothetical protein